jgi:hypothetical protein
MQIPLPFRVLLGLCLAPWPILGSCGPARAQEPGQTLPRIVSPTSAGSVAAPTGFGVTKLPRIVGPVGVVQPWVPPSPTPGLQCRQAIRNAERAAGIPIQLMAAIGRVESGRPDGQGSVHPWPWIINAEGVDHVFTTKAEAVAAVRDLQTHGVRSIDVGCMQVNLMHHPHAFATLEDAFDPVINANYAASFLVQLYHQTGNWQTATAWYHSATPELGSDYQRKVMAVWPDEQRHVNDPRLVDPKLADPKLADLGTGWSATRTQAGGGFMLSNRADHARIIPLPQSGTFTTGRGLDGYRAVPIPLAWPPARAPL